MGLQQFLDPGREEFALVEHGLQRAGQAGDDQRGSVGAGNDDGLLVERGEDVLDQAPGHPRCLRPYQADQLSASGLADLGRGTELVQQSQDGRVLHSRAQHPFQGRVDLCQQSPQPVADAGGLAGEVVVEPDVHLQLGDGLVSSSIDRRVCGIERAASAITNASRASVFASPG